MALGPRGALLFRCGVQDLDGLLPNSITKKGISDDLWIGFPSSPSELPRLVRGSSGPPTRRRAGGLDTY
jgi:hypothetical protein